MARALRHNPANPSKLIDRFVLSNQPYVDVCACIYGLRRPPINTLTTCGHSASSARTPGHPEHDPRLGIETTTGPLGPGPRDCGRHGAGRSRSRRANRALATRSSITIPGCSSATAA
ncbi:MAG: hypothetical protein R3E65_09320 [Steroidobacteraceae bacterium]